ASVQAVPAGQPGQSPPQSTPTSLPSITPLVHSIGRQTLPMQMFDAQSRGSMHASPLPQGAQVPPPQSMSVSLPLRMPSTQAPGWQKPPVHVAVESAQSALPMHMLPFGHFVLQLPPQSRSVSSPFCTPSLQLAATQTFGVPMHTLLAQSALR